MISVYPCNNQLCNTQMLIEDYSNAIYWRIAAIFSTIAALFSVAVVIWFLIFRDNPDLPDDTDSMEKSRFIDNIDKEKHNLLSEFLISLKNMSFFRFSNKTNNNLNKKPVGLMQKLGFLFFGPTSQDENSVCSLSINNMQDIEKTIETKQKNKTESNVSDENENSKKLKPQKSNVKRFFNIKKTNGMKNFNNNSSNIEDIWLLNQTNYDENSKNNNVNNNNRCSFSETFITKKSSQIKKFSSEKDFRQKAETGSNNSNKIELDDELLKELNKNFASLLDANYADALVKIRYFTNKDLILIEFDSIKNLSKYKLDQVRVIVDVFYKNKRTKRMHSKLEPMCLKSFENKDFNFIFKINLSENMSVNFLKLNIIIIGKVLNDMMEEKNKDDNIILISKSSPEIQILGGVPLNLKDYLENFNID